MNDLSVTLGKRSAYGGQYFLDENDRARHMYAIGRTGSGKTTLLKSLALQDINLGRGVCIIDPHGDNAQALANSIPKWRIKDTIYFDAADRENVIGFNPLTHDGTPDDAELVASEMVSMFKGLFRDSWGEWLEYLLKNTILTALFQPHKQATFLTVLRILNDAQFRREYVRHVNDRAVRAFWERYFDRLRDREELERISSTLNKVGKFELSPVLRNIFGSTRSGFDLKRVMDTNQILIVNLAKGRIGADNANFLGSALVSKIVSLALRRSAVPESDRVPFYLSIDEFQNFTTDEFTAIISEARKYALSLTICHQNFSQISEAVRGQLIKEAGTLVAFKVGFEDNLKLQQAFHPINPHELSSTEDGSFFVRVGVNRPMLVEGHHPRELDALERGSLERVRRTSRERYSRTRATVEADFTKWYEPKQRQRWRPSH